MKPSSIFAKAVAYLLLVCAFGAAQKIRAQSDNFDSGAPLSTAWKRSNFNAGLVTETFVDDGMGKGFRIRANPVPNTAPAAALYYRDDVYTDFYMAVDLVDWPGTDKNQAFVLFGRATFSSNPATTTGVICNYDTSQRGENATDPRQGEFQINLVTNNPAFGTKTLAVAEITLEPGHAYRVVFQAVGSLYTAMIYDHQDLTKPLITIHADDVIQGAQGGGIQFLDGFTSGKCGILAYSRASTTGTADLTIDNYFAAASDPNPAAAPALQHPVAGTPTVASRTPSARFQNFYNPSQGINFMAKTFTTDQINASATKLRLNGTDVSSQLILSGNGSDVTGSLPGAALAANTVYNASIELADVSGTKKSTNTFWFDTFSDAFVKNAAVRKIEAEDFNHDAGQFVPEPVPVSGIDKDGNPVNGSGVGYFGLGAIEGVDFHDNRLGPEAPWGGEYRDSTPVGLSAGMYPEVQDLNEPADASQRRSDNIRSQYAASNLLEYVVHRTDAGEWLNYTRTFLAGKYQPYLRVASFGATSVELHQVTSDPAQPNQTTTKLGTFKIPNELTHYNYRYIPLTDDGGAPVDITMPAGDQTLRLQMAGVAGADGRKIAINYLMLVPEAVTGAAGTVYDNFADNNDTANPAWLHFDPIGNITAPPATFAVTGGKYHLVAPTPAAPDAGPARAGSFINDKEFTDFYVAVDVVDFDDTVRQAFGIGARIVDPGLGTTGGYLFSWEPGGGTLPAATGGDLDISRIENESPVAQIETAPSGLHLTRGKSYRFVFMGRGADFEGQVYEYPDLTNPLIRLPAHDPKELYLSGKVGLIVADEGSGGLNPGDATFDNFLATTAEPRITVSRLGGSVTLVYPNTGFRLQTAATIDGTWTEVTAGITAGGVMNSYTTPGATGSAFYRLVFP